MFVVGNTLIVERDVNELNTCLGVYKSAVLILEGPLCLGPEDAASNVEFAYDSYNLGN